MAQRNAVVTVVEPVVGPMLSEVSEPAVEAAEIVSETVEVAEVVKPDTSQYGKKKYFHGLNRLYAAAVDVKIVLEQMLQGVDQSDPTDVFETLHRFVADATDDSATILGKA